MDIYASDEEKGEEIKQWWRDNGRSVLTSCVLGAAIVIGGRYWVSHQQTLTSNASVAYQQVVIAINEDDQSIAEDKTQQLFNEFSGTPYAVFAAFEMAAQTDNTSAAQTYLEWVMANADLSAHQELARLRLGQLLMSDGQYEQALTLIDQSESAAYSSLIAELRGDIFVAQGNASAANAEYHQAMLGLLQSEARNQLLQIKLDDVAQSNDS